jgi:hypothetical protein
MYGVEWRASPLQTAHLPRYLPTYLLTLGTYIQNNTSVPQNATLTQLFLHTEFSISPVQSLFFFLFFFFPSLSLSLVTLDFRIFGRRAVVVLSALVVVSFPLLVQVEMDNDAAPHHIEIQDDQASPRPEGQPSPGLRNSKGWDGKLRVQRSAVITNPEALSDPEYSDDENVVPGEEIVADEGMAYMQAFHGYALCRP